MFTPGRLVFICLFAAAFLIMLIWSYRKEKSVNKTHFNKTYQILLALLLFLLLQFLIVKIRKFL